LPENALVGGCLLPDEDYPGSRFPWYLAALSIQQIAGRLNLAKPKGAKSNLPKWMKDLPDDAWQPKLDIESAMARLLFYGLTP
jgi:hypothetical protein